MSRIKTLGGLALDPPVFTQPKPLLLLAYLALEGPQRRRRMAELFWRDGNRMKSLSMSVTRLRQGIGDGIEADETHVWTTVACDVRDVLDAIEADDWYGAADRYTGTFLEGVLIEGWNRELEEWVYATREHLAEQHQQALLLLAERAARQHDFQGAAAMAERAYAVPGLGGTDIDTLERLHVLLCAGHSELAADVRSEAAEYGVSLELTSSRARAKFKRSRGVTSALPVRGTSFIGRTGELAGLATLINRSSASLVTLVGPAGVGKTRLALQFCYQHAGRMFEGVYFASLDDVHDPVLIPSHLGTQMGLSRHGAKDPLEQVASFIGSRRLLLVLDNFEQLIEGAGLLLLLLARCPNLKLLVTSREKLRLEEESVYPVRGLEYAAPNAVVPDAFRLFEARAVTTRPDFRLADEEDHVAAICHLVEGSPLAIELAAGWVGALSCVEIAHEIRNSLDFLTSAITNVPEKHRSVRAAFDSSWRLLTGDEQVALSKLAVFRGGFSRGDAATVAGVTTAVLASLVDKSLVKFMLPARYAMHPLVHQYAEEKLAEHQQMASATKENHSKHFVQSVERAESKLTGSDQVQWFRWLSVEMANCLAALNHLEATGDVHNALRLAASLGQCWSIQGESARGLAYLERLLAGTTPGTRSEAKALLVAGELAALQGEVDAAEAYLERGSALAADLGDEVLTILIIRALGVIAHHHRGDVERARQCLMASLGRARTVGDPVTLATVLRSVGNLEVDVANNRAAQLCYEEAAALSKRMGDEHGYAKILCGLATVLTAMGDTDGALALNAQSLASFRAVGDLYGVGIALLNTGMSANRKGEPDRALACYRESLDLFRSLGNPQMVSHLLNNLGSLLNQRGAAGEAKILLEESLEIQRTVGNVFLKAQALHGLGNALDTLNRSEEAFRCYQDCLGVCRESKDKWSLMRVLDSLAKWHLARAEYGTARIAVAEAIELALASRELRVLASARQTAAALENVWAQGQTTPET